MNTRYSSIYICFFIFLLLFGCKKKNEKTSITIHTQDYYSGQGVSGIQFTLIDTDPSNSGQTVDLKYSDASGTCVLNQIGVNKNHILKIKIRPLHGNYTCQNPAEVGVEFKAKDAKDIVANMICHGYLTNKYMNNSSSTVDSILYKYSSDLHLSDSSFKEKSAVIIDSLTRKINVLENVNNYFETKIFISGTPVIFLDTINPSCGQAIAKIKSY